MGGAFGISLLSTFMTHQRQTQRVEMTKSTTFANPFFHNELNGLIHNFTSTGAGLADATHRALAQLSAQVDLQASLLSFKSAQVVMGFLMFVLFPLPFIMKRPSKEEAEAAAAAH